MRLNVALLVATSLCFAAPSTAFGQAADPTDVASIDAIVTAVYDVNSGDAGEARDWDRWHSLFAEVATLSAVVASPNGYRRVIMTPQKMQKILRTDGSRRWSLHRKNGTMNQAPTA